MKPINNEDLVSPSDIAEQTGMAITNVKKTYIKNQYGKDKSKILKVIKLGAFCSKNNVTPKELIFAIGIVTEARKLNG